MELSMTLGGGRRRFNVAEFAEEEPKHAINGTAQGQDQL
jgi:hypothetical protein